MYALAGARAVSCNGYRQAVSTDHMGTLPGSCSRKSCLWQRQSYYLTRGWTHPTLTLPQHLCAWLLKTARLWAASITHTGT